MEKYEKIKIVGRGAYGTVHLCRRHSDQKLLIMKQIAVDQMTKEERQTALNEVKVLAMLNHPNIIEYYENFLEDKALMIVMEYAQGGTLYDYLQQRNSQLLEEERVLLYLSQMLLSLQHVHSNQILHRDLKTQNILMGKQHNVIKIGDFGISKFLSSKSKAYTVVGTPCYISPELCEGKPYNQKSDIWALGCVLYELCTLRRAFEAQNLPALVLKIMRGSFPPVPECYSRQLRALTVSMLQLDPGQRPSVSHIMAQPVVLNALLSLYTDFGKVPCTRVQRPLSRLSSASRGQLSRSGSNPGPKDELPSKLSALSRVYCWGGGLAAPLTLAMPAGDTHVTQVSAGRTQKAAVTQNGHLIVWETATLASDSSVARSTHSATYQPEFVPRFLEGQSGVTIQHVSCGDLYTACLTDRGILMTFGSGASGCLGHGNHKDISQAKIVETLLGFEVSDVACGASHVLAVTTDNELFSWGRGDNGRLGLDSHEAFCTPQLVATAADYRPHLVACGVDCSMLLTVDSRLLCCGSNRFNKLAIDGATTHTSDVLNFTPIKSLPLAANVCIKMVAMGTSHSVALTESGECYTFGSNHFGQLGYSTEQQCERLVRRVDIPPATHVACGDTFTVAVTTGGSVFSWGKSSRGRLGRPSDTSPLPQPVAIGDGETLEVTSLCCRHGTTLLAASSSGQKTS